MSLARVFLGSLGKRRVATAFSATAIVLGVALGMAVQAVHESALSEFGRGMRSIAGQADLLVVGPRGGFDERLYEQLAQRAELAQISPVVEVELRLPGRKETLQLLGLDAFTLAAITPALLPRPAPGADRFALLSGDTVFLSAAALAALDLKIGDPLPIVATSGTATLRIAGDIPGSASSERLAVMDIAAVQTLFARLGRLTRLDLKLREGLDADTAAGSLRPLLPAGVQIEAPEQAVDQAANLSRAYRVNLTLLAAMALLTGGFLVFSAQALSVVRRRTEFAFLRAIGLPANTLFAWLLGEGAVVGLIGGLLGVLLGHGLAWGALALLGGDLGAGFFSGSKPTLQFQPLVSAAYVALGVLAGMAGAWLPAREAARVAPAQALKSGDLPPLFEGHGRPFLGLFALTASLPACALPPILDLPLGGYLAVALLLAGGVLLLPVCATVLARILPTGAAVAARLARARLRAAPGNAVVAAAGVMTSVALAGAMAIMVTSFRGSVEQWLGQVLPADLYLRSGRGAATLDEDLQTRVSAVPGIGKVNFTRFDSLRLATGSPPVMLLARPVSADGHELPLVGATQPAAGPSLWVSEAMQDLYGWRVGQLVEIPVGGQWVKRPISGVWRDYARQTGSVLLDLADYRALTGDRFVNDAAITLASGASAVQVAQALNALAPGTLEVAYPGQIRAISLRIFDRTFAVTYALEAVAVAIGLAGVAASFAALAASRRREFGMLRHLGLTRRQIGAMLALEGALAAGVGVLSGLLIGGAIGLILIEVVNRQSFHWSMDLHIPWLSLGAFGLSLTALAALSAVVAGRSAMQQDAVLAVRDDW